MARFLKGKGLRFRDWQKDPLVPERVQDRNARYTNEVEAELIHAQAIPRDEAKKALTALKDGTNRDIVLVGAAGMGKSCSLAQIVAGLRSEGTPHLVLRLDRQTKVQTADGFGKELNLPASPAIVLAGLANGARSVLLIDQLDALSYASGRNQDLWSVFEEILAETRRYPKMRVLFACRGFDADHDHRIKRLLSSELSCQRIDLAPLSLEIVKAAVERAGLKPGTLRERDLALLQTPQNLSLFLQGDPTKHDQIGSVQVLLDRFWQHKQQRVAQRVPGPSRWLPVIRTLAAWLSKNQTLSAPADILDEFRTEVDVMASEHVLVLDAGNTCRFFHESVFDYAFARTFVSDGGNAESLLLKSGKQHLFRRAQVRQVLTYERDRSYPAYLVDLQAVLGGAGIRTHIKKLILDWLRSLSDPRPEEWHLVQALGKTPLFSRWWKVVPHDSPGWFDLLLREGTWHAWLTSPENELVENAVWLLALPNVIRERSVAVAALIKPCLDGSPLWQKRFRQLVRFGEISHSREMFDLALDAVRRGWFDDINDHWFHQLHKFPEKAPNFAAELLESFLRRRFEIVPEGDPFEGITETYLKKGR